MDTIRTVELFAGVGGFRLGLEAASDRFKVIWANQWEPSMRDQYAFECYTAHFGCTPDHVCQDIAKAKTAVPDHDLLVGGFPCQDYSIMKKNSDGDSARWDVVPTKIEMNEVLSVDLKVQESVKSADRASKGGKE